VLWFYKWIGARSMWKKKRDEWLFNMDNRMYEVLVGVFGNYNVYIYVWEYIVNKLYFNFHMCYLLN
jgi:hypothetical protein